MSSLLTGKVAVVTGAGRGIGREYALALVAAGAAVVVSDVAGAGFSAAEEVAAQIRDGGGRAVATPTDVSVQEDVNALVATATDEFGGLDIMIANAGVARPGKITELPVADWLAMVAVHATGTFHSIQAATPALRQRGGGSIVTVGDITTDLYYPGNGGYRAVKAAVASMTMYAAEELAGSSINVNSIMPGATRTAMVDTYLSSIDRESGDFADFVDRANSVFQRPEGVSVTGPSTADTVPPLGVFLCSDEARSITGRFFITTGGLVRLVGRQNTLTDVRVDGPGWTVEELRKRVPDLVTDNDVAIGS